MLLETLTQDLRRARVTNATDNGFPSRLPTITEPVGTGNSAAQATASAVFVVGGEHPSMQNRVFIKPFGVGSNNNTFSMRVIAWSRVFDHTGNDLNTFVWDPTVLCELTCTLSSTPIGLAGKIITATDLFADTIAIATTTANAGVSIDVVSPANDTAGHVVLDLKGAQKVEFTFTTGASATSCNALVRMY